MAIYSPLRSRRLAAQQTEATQRSIVFKLWAETFAIPFDRVHKVTTLDAAGEKLGQRLYGDPNDTGFSLTTYQGRELVVIDVGYQIFGKSQQALLPTQPIDREIVSTRKSDLVKYLLILHLNDEEQIGLPIDSPPSIQSIQLSAFQPLPAIYRQHSNIHCVRAMSIDQPDRPSIFLLDVDSLGKG
ncbi:chemotaxis protein CheW [Chamaesiphon sp. VAR_48_metabat_135_sub]|uniref:chemotaxis protein CheW n=1 Tax=Chamaesiphon sp. VAR_48_metabat_135_sub TaxID=2964699 RepID=UPI00286D35ED|nr:chemotaxis protein CheW [Chamaesiphon sp. VAR_48_metabat_135_sub]